MLKTEILLLTNNCVIPFQNINLDYISLNKIFATQSVSEHGLGFMINIYDIDDPNDEWNQKLVKKYVFDTGGLNKTFLHNVNVRAYRLYDVDAILISHWHYDHIGALCQMLEQIEEEIPVICHEAANFERFFRRSMDVDINDYIGKKRKSVLNLLSTAKIINQAPIDLKHMKEINAKIIFTKESLEIFNQEGLKVILSGEIPRTHPEEDFNNFILLQDGLIKLDKVLDDKCLIFEFSDNVVILLGCCHSGIMNTLDYVKSITEKPITHIIGGFHVASANEQRIKHTIEYLETFQESKENIFLFPIHCSGENFLFKLKNLKKSNLRAFNLSVGSCFTFHEK